MADLEVTFAFYPFLQSYEALFDKVAQRQCSHETLVEMCERFLREVTGTLEGAYCAKEELQTMLAEFAYTVHERSCMKGKTVVPEEELDPIKEMEKISDKLNRRQNTDLTIDELYNDETSHTGPILKDSSTRSLESRAYYKLLRVNDMLREIVRSGFSDIPQELNFWAEALNRLIGEEMLIPIEA
jgi:hypothetical protein